MTKPTAEEIRAAIDWASSVMFYDDENGGLMDPPKEIGVLSAAYLEAIEALRELMCFGVEMDDARLDYVVAQVEKDDIERANAVLAKAPKEGRRE